MLDLISHIKNHLLTMANTCLRLMGHMATCTYVVSHTRFHLWPLQAWLALVYIPSRHALDRVFTVPSHVLLSLDWWLDPLDPLVLQEVPFMTPSLSLTLVSDVSDLDWGAHLGELNTQGHWLHSDLAFISMSGRSKRFAWPEGQGDAGPDGQYSCDVLHQQVGWRQALGPLSGSAQPLGFLDSYMSFLW